MEYCIYKSRKSTTTVPEQESVYEINFSDIFIKPTGTFANEHPIRLKNFSFKYMYLFIKYPDTFLIIQFFLQIL